MHILEYSRSCRLPAAPEAVFEFHADPRNIVHVSPPGQEAEIRSGIGPAQEGAEFEVLVTLFGYIPMRWQARWLHVERPSLLCDVATSAIFPHWEHRHEFEPTSHGGTILTDRLRYALPGGWLGWQVGQTAMRAIFAGMFAYRHRRTQEYFKEH